MNKSLEQYMPDGSKVPYRFMKYRIHKILLVCCSYDGYILEEDGHIIWFLILSVIIRHVTIGATPNLL